MGVNATYFKLSGHQFNNQKNADLSESDLKIINNGLEKVIASIQELSFQLNKNQDENRD